jgi:metal binding Ada-like protein
MSGEKIYYLLGPDRKKHASKKPGMFGGHSGRRIYGQLDCPFALRAIAKGGYVSKRVFFSDEAAAIAAGYRPCARCMPERYKQWKHGT